MLKKQGFKIVTDNSDADTVFQKRLPAGDYDFSMFIQVTSPDPTVTSILSLQRHPVGRPTRVRVRTTGGTATRTPTR